MSARPTVLLADPDPHVSAAVAALLRRRGYAVEAVSSCPAAEARLREELPDLLIAELLLPGGSGARLTELAKARSDGRLPTVMVSSLSAAIHGDYARLAGADVYLPKPFRASALMAAAWRLCPVALPVARLAEAG